VPLVLDPEALPMETLRALLKEQTEGVTELLEWATHPAAPVKETLGVLTALDLLKSALEVGRRAEHLQANRAEIAAAVNVQYEASLAAIDLVKMHSDLPKVPRGRASPSA
jgi:hypothetical protein